MLRLRSTGKTEKVKVFYGQFFFYLLGWSSVADEDGDKKASTMDVKINEIKISTSNTDVDRNRNRSNFYSTSS